MSSLCREFGVSRKTGYKFYNRYKEYGLLALEDRSRVPLKYGNQLPEQMERQILLIKDRKPFWGAPKIRNGLERKYPGMKLPAISTIHAVLSRHGLVTRRGRARYRSAGTGLSAAVKPNDLWCADYKGQFMLDNKKYCYPLTITDNVSRYLFACEALESVQERWAFEVFERVFEERGLPLAIRTDNGVPFASPKALFGLSHLSVWWLSLGISIEKIKPGNPQQNGRHERMHRTLKKEATKPAAGNFLQQQEKFDRFLTEYNNERPHEALSMKYPSECYAPSLRPYKGPVPFDYSMHDMTLPVSQCGEIHLRGKRVYLSTALAGQPVALTEQDDEVWTVAFRDYELGFFDMESLKFAPGANPFGPKVLPMCPE